MSVNIKINFKTKTMNKEISKEEAIIHTLRMSKCELEACYKRLGYTNSNVLASLKMAIEALEDKPPVISDDVLIKTAQEYSTDKSEQMDFIVGAEWMRDQLTNKD